VQNSFTRPNIDLPHKQHWNMPTHLPIWILYPPWRMGQAAKRVR